jgi:hypothetical protein
MINEIKEDTNRCSKEFQETTNKQLNETRKIMQDVKEKFNKTIEILKNIKLKFWKRKSQLK